VAVLIVLVRRHRCAVGAVVRQVVDGEVPGAVEEEAGPAAVRRVPPGLFLRMKTCSTHREVYGLKPGPFIMIRVAGSASHLRGC